MIRCGGTPRSQQRFVGGFGILVHACLGCGAERHAEAAIIDVQDAEAHSAQRLAMPHLPGGEGGIGIAMQMQDPVARIVGAIRVKQDTCKFITAGGGDDGPLRVDRQVLQQVQPAACLGKYQLILVQLQPPESARFDQHKPHDAVAMRRAMRPAMS